jgi:hypothetical protein
MSFWSFPLNSPLRPWLVRLPLVAGLASRRAAAAALLLLAVPLAARARDLVVLEGRVVDGSEAPVAGAKVVLQTSPERVVRTADDGGFQFDGLEPAWYTLIVEAEGFAPLVAQARAGEPREYRLEPAPLFQVVEVNGGTFDQIRLDEPLFQTGLSRADIATRTTAAWPT